jgi:hypothetical protein
LLRWRLRSLRIVLSSFPCSPVWGETPYELRLPPGPVIIAMICRMPTHYSLLAKINNVPFPSLDRREETAKPQAGKWECPNRSHLQNPKLLFCNIATLTPNTRRMRSEKAKRHTPEERATPETASDLWHKVGVGNSQGPAWFEAKAHIVVQQWC